VGGGEDHGWRGEEACSWEEERSPAREMQGRRERCGERGWEIRLGWVPLISDYRRGG